jgi:hypothetical protein
MVLFDGLLTDQKVTSLLTNNERHERHKKAHPILVCFVLFVVKKTIE